MYSRRYRLGLGFSPSFVLAYCLGAIARGTYCRSPPSPLAIVVQVAVTEAMAVGAVIAAVAVDSSREIGFAGDADCGGGDDDSTGGGSFVSISAGGGGDGVGGGLRGSSPARYCERLDLRNAWA
eukprot:CAMPEP_0171795578 /NCGR_PEP_ID=MMETSP0991-20121206/68803_1 /TAXON_ID=483369 /ORGANISM="non described non described, Strain CCMP2098" /LENGTH=123 /DNA_ID=CAMNT_0012406195 /DNA_START=19 /DNA_END=390 /DNA_ORIENTATION=-